MVETSIQKPLISVVMPTYNHARLIGEAIKSVLCQSYGNLELIIIDNYSGDGTEDIVCGCAENDARIRYFKFNNRGIIANSRNKGIHESRGDYIAFIDSDDMWHREKLERQIGLFNRPEIGFVYCPCITIDCRGDIVNAKNVSKYYRGYVLPELLRGELSIVNSSIVVRKNILEREKLLFRTNRQGAEDWDLWLRLASVTMADYIDVPLAYYRVHSNAVSTDYKMMCKSTIQTLDDFQESCLRKFDNDDIKNKMLLKCCRQARVICLDKYANYLLGDCEYLNTLRTVIKIIMLNIVSPIGWCLLFKIIAYPFWKTVTIKNKLRQPNQYRCESTVNKLFL